MNYKIKMPMSEHFSKFSKQMFAQHWFPPILSDKKKSKKYMKKNASLFIF